MGWYDDLDTALGGVLPGGVPSNFPAFDPFGLVGPVNTAVQVQPVNQLPSAAAATGVSCSPPPPMYTGAKPILKFVCGQYKWIYPKRRARKQLFTARDASQLSNLIQTAGKDTQITKSWIATHPS